MQKKLIAIALVAAFAAPAFAEEAAAPASEHTVTGNVGVFSSYRFRGIDQTNGKPAIQGGIDYSHSSGLYLGNWNSNVSSGAGYPDGNIEMDFYGGYKTTFGDFGLDVGGLYYYYPGSDATPLSGTNAKNLSKTASGTVHNGEIYVAGSWKFLSLKYSHAVTNYFSLPDSKNTGYLDLSANYDLGNGWGINGHVGHLYAKHFEYNTIGDQSISYTDWKLGVSKDVGAGWILGAAYVGTNAKGSCSSGEFYCFFTSVSSNGNTSSKTKDAGRDTLVLSVSKTF